MAYTYYTVDITTYNDGTADAKSIQTFTADAAEEAKNNAIGYFHRKIGNSASNSAVSTITCYVLNPATINPVKYERFVAYVAPEEDTTDEEDTTTDSTDDTTTDDDTTEETA